MCVAAFHSRERNISFHSFIHFLLLCICSFNQRLLGNYHAAKKLGLEQQDSAFMNGHSNWEVDKKGLCKPINIDMSTVTRSVRLNHLS